MTKLSLRQSAILDFLRQNKQGSNRDIKQYVERKIEGVNRITIVRDLDELLQSGLLRKEGEGRSVVYRLVVVSPLLQYFDPGQYFQNPPDNRAMQERFNFDVFDYFTDTFFSETELKELDAMNEGYRSRVAHLSPTLLKKEFERLTIELSWKSSQIEGNTYSLIDTEILIKEHKEASGHTKEEAQMILNHKVALDYILADKGAFMNLTLHTIQNLHRLVIDGLNIERNIRKRLVGITGTKFKPLDNEFQIVEALEKMNAIINNENFHPLVKSLATVLLISYIQPFEDGNKRTARLLGNAVLLANGYCPLSYRSVDQADYKKATLLFYEQNSAQFFKELFVEQFKFATENYFIG